MLFYEFDDYVVELNLDGMINMAIVTFPTGVFFPKICSMIVNASNGCASFWWKRMRLAYHNFYFFFQCCCMIATIGREKFNSCLSTSSSDRLKFFYTYHEYNDNAF